MSDTLWDVAIVGAGPAGATAAICLARLGRSVLLLDRKEFPREKTCGDALIADSINCLDRLDLLAQVRAEALEIEAADIYSPSRLKLTVQGQFLTLSRFRFDEILVQDARNSGAEFLHSRVVKLAALRNEVEIWPENESEPVRAKVCLLATGADVSLARKLGNVSEFQPSGYAVRFYVKSDYHLDHLVFSFDREILPGYAWVFPMPDYVFNIGYGFFVKSANSLVNVRRQFERFCQSFPLTRQILEHGEILTEVRGAPLRCRLQGSRFVGPGNILSIGETIGTTFPFTGEGIGKAMESGELAAGVVNRYLRNIQPESLGEYSKELHRVLVPKYQAYEVSEFWQYYPWLGDFIARRGQKSKSFRAALSGILDESVNFRSAFSWGLLRSFFS